jgi:uncharacterized membrane protein YdbT with pleckstrin-like domain
MIPLNSWQRLPPKALWFGLLSSLAIALVLVGAGSLILLAGHAGTLRCNGATCGSKSGTLTVGFIYLYAIFLVGRSVLYYRTFAFLLTDKTLTTVAGYFYQRSCTFRLDRIQDVDTFRGPLHALLGVETVAIWTSSPDQSPRGRGCADQPRGSRSIVRCLRSGSFPDARSHSE